MGSAPHRRWHCTPRALHRQILGAPRSALPTSLASPFMRRCICTRMIARDSRTSAATAPGLRFRRSGSPNCPTAVSPTGSSAPSGTAASSCCCSPPNSYVASPRWSRPRRAHLIRYHGVFAPASRWRSQVIPPLRECTPSTPPCASAVPSEDPAPAATGTPPGQATAEVRRPAASSRIPWAELLMRVFREDVLACPCGGRRVVLAYLTQPGPVKIILDHLGLRPLVHLSRLPARAEDSPSNLAGRRARAAAVVEGGRSRPAHPYALNSPCAAGAWHGRGLLC